ncbi:cyclic nucleotide-gated ion channel 20 [Spatholobus suberectus]|nr:cyclic nucleotide-gated ion channel 20 [Spatholobus suberectus]
MANFEKDGERVPLETHALHNELEKSRFGKVVSRTKSAAIFIPMVSMEQCERETSFVGHTDLLQSESYGDLLTHLAENQRVNQCLRDACGYSHVDRCMRVIDCGRHGHIRNKQSDQASALWRNNADAIACLNPSSSGFHYGIYVNAVPLTIETSVVNKYVYSLFWGFQVQILLSLYLITTTINGTRAYP